MAEFVGSITFEKACKASKRGQKQIIEEWLSQSNQSNNEVDRRSQLKGSTLLSWACFGGQLEITRWLLEEKNAGKTQNENNGWTLLHNACCSGNTDLVRYLVESQQIDVLTTDENGDTALQVAINQGKAGPSLYLLSKDGIEVNWQPTNAQAFKAAGAGILEVVKVWLQAGGNVNQLYKGKTLLHCACKKGQMEIARFLVLEAGASVEVVAGPFGRTALSNAVASNHIELAEWLRQQTNVPVDYESARAAAENGHLPYLQEYISNGGSVNQIAGNGTWGLTLTHYAAIGGQLETVKWLVTTAGAQVDPEDDAQPSPLSYACEFDSWNVAEWLVLEGGARNIEYEAALRAAQKGSLVVVKAFLQSRDESNPSENEQKQLNALLEKAVENNNQELATWLRTEAGANGPPGQNTDTPASKKNIDIFSEEGLSDSEEESDEEKHDSCASENSSEEDDSDDESGDY